MNSRRERFIDEYLVDMNGAAAARRAGYSAACARQTASDLLAIPDVARALQRRREAVAKRLSVTHDSIVLGLIEAFETARENSDARAMISACEKLAEFCGLYPHRTRRPEVGGRDSLRELVSLTDAELRELVRYPA